MDFVISNIHADLWIQATETHPFLKGCIDGTVSDAQFNTWLLQDYLFVKSFQKFSVSTTSDALPSHVSVLNSGLDALTDELKWFEEKLMERNINFIDATPLPTTEQYGDFLEEAVQQSYKIKASVLYVIERVYQLAWGNVLKTILLQGVNDHKYKEFAERWSNPLFVEYVDKLQEQANELTGDEGQKREWERRVLEQEVLFWDMALL